MEDRSDWQERMGVGERQYLFGRHAGGTNTKTITNELDGKPGGKTVEHWDGRQDAVVTPRPYKVTRKS